MRYVKIVLGTLVVLAGLLIVLEILPTKTYTRYCDYIENPNNICPLGCKFKEGKWSGWGGCVGGEGFLCPAVMEQIRPNKCVPFYK